MPNPITPRSFGIIMLASMGKDVAGFALLIPEALLIVAKEHAKNYGLQFISLTVGSTIAGGSVDPIEGIELINRGAISLMTASTVEEATARGSMVESVSAQQYRAKQFNETVLHVINLFRLKPVDRTEFKSSFHKKVSQFNLKILQNNSI